MLASSGNGNGRTHHLTFLSACSVLKTGIYRPSWGFPENQTSVELCNHLADAERLGVALA